MSHEPIPEEVEEIPARPIVWTIISIVLTVVACGVIVWALDAFRLTGGGRSNVEQLELGLPAQPFSEPMRVETARSQERVELEAWSWSDRARQRIRVPVGVAIDRYVEQRGAR